MDEFVVEKCIERVNNRFKLVLLASQRTHQLNTGASNLVQATKFQGHKNTIVSLGEIAENLIDIHELFNLLINRCKEYMKENMSKAYSNDVSQLANLLKFSGSQLNVDLDAGQEGQDNEIND